MAKHDPWNPLGEWLEDVIDTTSKAFSEVASAPLDARNWDFLDRIGTRREEPATEETSETEEISAPSDSPDWYDSDSDDGTFESDSLSAPLPSLAAVPNSTPADAPSTSAKKTDVADEKDSARAPSKTFVNALTLLAVVAIAGVVLSDSSRKSTHQRWSIRRELMIASLFLLGLTIVGVVVKSLQ